MKTIEKIKNIFRKKKKPPRDDTVKNYVESFFAPIRYSKASSEAKGMIIEKLKPEYDALKAENKANAFERFVSKYPGFEMLLAAAGIDRAKADEWKNQKVNTTYDAFWSLFKKRRRWTWIITAMFVFAAIITSFISLYFSMYSIPMIVVDAVLIVLAVVFAVRLFPLNERRKPWNTFMIKKSERTRCSKMKRSLKCRRPAKKRSFSTG